MRHRLFLVLLFTCMGILAVPATEEPAPPEVFEIIHREPNPADPGDAYRYQIPEYEFQSMLDQKTGLWNYNR